MMHSFPACAPWLYQKDSWCVSSSPGQIMEQKVLMHERLVDPKHILQNESKYT